MSLNKFFSALLLATPLALFAGHPPSVDHSKADADGPHVYYIGAKIVVKTLERRDTSLFLKTRTYQRKGDILLTCKLPETGDNFSFPLHRDLKVPAFEYDMPARMLVLSDIEGNFKGFKMMLQGAKVVDDKFNWIYGKGHLVLLGDYFDRGLNVTECLWLAYKLEAEAEAAGGKVHFIMGNHEVLNLSGVTQYVRNKYMENAKLYGDEYPSWFSDDTELGRWLRSKNAVEKIGDYVFCHGGISPEMASSGISLKEINRIGRKFYGMPYELIEEPSALTVFDGQTGIYWYRGAARNKLSDREVDLILRYAGAKHMVVAHTLVPEVSALYDGRVICVDLYHDENVRRGFMKTLFMEDGITYSLDHKGEKTTVFSVAATKSSSD